MSSLTITKPSSGDTDWGVTLNTALDEIVEHANTHNHGRIKENGYLTIEPDSDAPAFGRVLVTDASSSSGKAWINSEVKESAFNKSFGDGENDVARGNHTHSVADITELAAQLSGKANTDHDHIDYADVSHSHSDYVSSIATINNTLQTINDSISILQNTINLLLPDLGSVTIEADIDNIGGGIRITCTTSPIILIRSWNIKVRSLGSLIYNSENSSNVVFISGELLSETESNTLLSITVTANSGQTTKAETFSFTYVKTPSLIDAKLASFQDIIDNELTIANILDSIANDANVCQAQANMLQHSNTLVTKIINDDDFVTKIAEEIIAKQNA